MTPEAGGLRMRDVVERTGVGEATLRAWEQRYGFPEPERLPSGHRRYGESDVEQVRQVLRLRDTGLPVRAAIERAQAGRAGGPRSVFAGLRRLRPEPRSASCPSDGLVALSHAIEDESACARGGPAAVRGLPAGAPLPCGRAPLAELGRAAEAAFVFADFAAPRRPGGGPIEVPISEDEPLAASGRSSATAATARAASSAGSAPARSTPQTPSACSRRSGRPIARRRARLRGSAASSPQTRRGPTSSGSPSAWPSPLRTPRTSCAAPSR